MYHKIARGYATQFVNSLQDHAVTTQWLDGRKRYLTLREMDESSKSKKPGRVIKRLSPHLRPAFSNPMIGLWMKDFKIVMADAVTSARENTVFDLSTTEAPLYQERSVFLTNLILTNDYEDTIARLMTVSNIGHHALTRLLERELATPKNLKRHVLDMLGIARNIALTIEKTSLDPLKPYAFLIPYEDGALPAVTMDVLPDVNDASSRTRVVSIRTFLDKDMLTREHHERMGGLVEAQRAVFSDEMQKPMVRWLEVNARPFSIAAAVREEAERQAGREPEQLTSSA
jgi:hypothetical protein